MSRSSKRQARRVVPATASNKSVIGKAAGSSRAAERDFDPDYTPVIKDLKRIGTLAGTFFVVLIVLSFFLK